MRSQVLSVVLAFCRGWLFGVVVGFVLGGGLGTFFVPILGTVYGAVIGVTLGAIAGLGAGALVAPAALLRPSPADRIWPGAVAASLVLVLAGKVVFGGVVLRPSFDAAVVLGLAGLAGVLSAGFGPTVIRGVRIRRLRTSAVVTVGASVGGVVAVARFLAVEGWAEPALFVALTTGAIVVGGILGLTLVAFNLLVTKEPAAE